MSGRSIAVVGDALLITVHGDLHDELMQDIQSDIAEELDRRHRDGVLLDVSKVEVIDTYIARAIEQVGRLANVMGARLVVVGIGPAIAMTLVELGVELHIETARDVDRGLAALRS